MTIQDGRRKKEGRHGGQKVQSRQLGWGRRITPSAKKKKKEVEEIQVAGKHGHKGNNTWWGRTQMVWDGGTVARGGLRGNIFKFMGQEKKRREEKRREERGGGTWTMDNVTENLCRLSGGRSKAERDCEVAGGVRLKT